MSLEKLISQRHRFILFSEKLTDIPTNTREAILFHLKVQGESTIVDLCEVLGLSYMAIKRYLGEFKSSGLVEASVISGRKGRPSYSYRLTGKGRALFPSGYEAVLDEILTAVHQESGPKAVVDLLKIRNRRLLRELKPRFKNKDLKSKVAELASVFADTGYMTQWEELPDGKFFIYQRHCPLHNLAEKFRQLCALEPQLMSSLLDVRVTRESYILKNDPVCGYIVHAD